MANLSSNYLGLNLNSPLIVSSSGLSDDIDKLKLAEDNGAGAVVLKSLFEEQINFQAGQLAESSDYPEAADYINYYTRSNSLDNYLKLIRKAGEKLSLPVIPSINCVSSSDWISFAKNIEEAGARALEINMFFLPVDKNISANNAEDEYMTLVKKLKGSLSIPISLKIGQRFSNLLNVVDRFYNMGVDGVVLFNRFYEPDIDINSMNITPASVFSSTSDRRYVLRWIAMVDAFIEKIGLSASTGVQTGQDAIKYILAGADSVQVCSVLYSNGLEYLKEMNTVIEKWMDDKGFDSVDSFKGKLNYKNIKDPRKYERAQFMKYFSSYE
jgi:dihydroorotate dehydrogenase (fumarate)